MQSPSEERYKKLGQFFFTSYRYQKRKLLKKSETGAGALALIID